MSKQNASYWAKRQALLMYDRMESAEQIASEIAEIYYHAARTIAHDMAEIFKQFRGLAGLSEKDALKVLNLMRDPGDVRQLSRALSKLGTDQARALRAYINAPEVQRNLQRLQDLQEQVIAIGRDIYGQDLSKQRQFYTALGRDTYYHTIYDAQREVGFQFSFAHIDDKLVTKIMNSSWGSPSTTFSKRLWANIDGVTKEVRKQLTLGLITGKTEKRMSAEIANKYQVGAFESRRLIRTEACYLSNEVQFEAYKEVGADRYMYIATLDSRTDEECGELDRKIFYVRDKKPGVNCPPMHPFCRCSTKIYIDQATRDDMKRRARNPKTGRNVLVPANTSYVQWARDNGLTGNSSKKKKK